MKSEGVCNYCKEVVSSRSMARHILSCKERMNKINSEDSSDSENKIFLIHAKDGPFFLYFEINANSKLKDVDLFLRKIWLECCGHLSVFKINNIDYDSDEGMDMFGDTGSKTMDIQLRKVLKPEMNFSQEYDFGSTTYLDLKVISERNGRLKEINLVSRNNLPEFKCDECSAPAKEICTECIYDGKGFLCEMCAKKHKCDEDMFLPVVNSPRIGVCGYTGD